MFVLSQFEENVTVNRKINNLQPRHKIKNIKYARILSSGMYLLITFKIYPGGAFKARIVNCFNKIILKNASKEQELSSFSNLIMPCKFA